MTQLSHKVILITGAARGIGGATAKELARRGARPVLTDLDADALAATAATITPAVIEQRGYVAITASLASFVHGPSMSAYAATKAGVEALANSLRTEVAHHGVEVGTIHATWIDTDMVREFDEEPFFKRLRGSLRWPFKRTYPVERAVKDIVKGFEARRRRICTPPFVYALHALRPMMTTRMFERDQLAIAPEMEQAFRQELAEHGAERASMSARVAAQVTHSIEV